MKNLKMFGTQLAHEIPSDNVRYTQDPKFGLQTKEVRSEKSTCCVCKERFWQEEKEVSTWLHEGYKVMDARAYVGGLPDYIKNSHVLLEVHHSCASEMNARLDRGEYIV